GSRLSSERPLPRRIRALKQRPSQRRKSGIYLLEGAGPQGSGVVAKRCRKADAAIERAVYQEVLSRLELPLLRFYGCVEDQADGETAWLFIEDAAGEEYSPLIEAHRAHAGRWLGRLHGSATGL